ncbi:hypothetical protein I317_06447 [Kwoniella heveanensis CBS 569]|nr:hypothetical protein I317_06447 [Kwoniella heveanensis CBS 569]
MTSFGAPVFFVSIPACVGLTLPRDPKTYQTSHSDKLQTWWHDEGEINSDSPIADGVVRQSHVYTLQISTSNDVSEKYYDSFVYESIPRSGFGKRLSPNNDSVGGNVDGVSIEPVVGIDMAWSQFLYACDAIVKITRADGYPEPDASKVVIRPTTQPYEVTSDGRSLYIRIPYSERGHKLSVEFQDDLYEYHTGGADGLFVQDSDPSGANYVSSYNSSQVVVGIEPKHALLVFASAFPTSDQVPDPSDSATYTVPPGFVSSLESVNQSTVYFGPGVYWFGGSNHANLSPSVNWVHLAPGAYVKGAIEYHTKALLVKATGYGVLSGEQYVYQANKADDYSNNKSDATSLRMWSGGLTQNQTWLCHGPTVNAPPFNTMDFEDQPVTLVSDYKQVGAWFWQTDGFQVYPNSVHTDIFYHVGDDCIKTYYSHVDIARLIVWKTTNDPIFQMGWAPRNVTNVTATDVSVIHARYPAPNMVVPTALIGASPNYLDISATNNAALNSRITNFYVGNLNCEGLCPSIVRLNLLQNYDNFTIDRVSIESFPPAQTGIGLSIISSFTDADGNPSRLGSQSPSEIGLTIKDYYVGGELVSLEKNNWQSDRLGGMDIDPTLWGQWTIV